MLISMNWIKDYVDLSNVDLKALINRFTLSTAEVEDIVTMGDDIQNVVAAKILEVKDHETSKKLHILTVFDGESNIQVVCGAPNVKENMIVPFARLGGRVGDLSIAEATIAGTLSYGMCCSEKELGISDDNNGLMELDSNTVLGTNIKDLFPIDDLVFEVDNKSLTNRPDLWGMYGIAREIAALTKRELKPLELTEVDDSLEDVSLNIVDTNHCFRYSSVVIENITKKISPITMKIRLNYCGMRSLNLLADLTNYIMLELGQPMHAFDYKIVPQITVKSFPEELSFTTLDNIERKVPKDALMICNGDVPVCIAGVMGGLDSAINDNTTSVLLESANFDGVSVRKTATAINLRTDASARYEKIIDPEITVTAVKRFVKLLLDIDKNAVVKTKITDVYSYKYPVINLDITKNFIDKYTGIKISNDTIIETLTALGFIVNFSNDTFNVTIPSFRATKDVTIKADLIEEITRIYGYDNFMITTTKTDVVAVVQDEKREDEYSAKQYLSLEHSLNEVHSYIWNQSVKDKELGIKTPNNVMIVNSLAAANNTLRTDITPALLGYLSTNKQNDNIGIYEIGRVVKGLKADGLCDERKSLSVVVASKLLSEQENFYKTKAILESLILNLKNIPIEYGDVPAKEKQNYLHDYNSQGVYIYGKFIGVIAVVHPLVKNNIDKKMSISFIELDFNTLAEIDKNPVVYNEISKYPGVLLDLSFIINKSTIYQEVKNHLDCYKNQHLLKYEFVGLYTDEGLQDKQSLTLRFHFGSNDSTLSGEEINVYSQEIINHMKEKNMVLR